MTIHTPPKTSVDKLGKLLCQCVKHWICMFSRSATHAIMHNTESLQTPAICAIHMESHAIGIASRLVRADISVNNAVEAMLQRESHYSRNIICHMGLIEHCRTYTWINLPLTMCVIKNAVIMIIQQ